jgi:hypothetical protein
VEVLGTKGVRSLGIALGFALYGVVGPAGGLVALGSGWFGMVVSFTGVLRRPPATTAGPRRRVGSWLIAGDDDVVPLDIALGRR